MASYDIIIVGGGVAGLSAAYFLSKSARVLVLERESQPAYHASGRSAALYIEGYENEVVSQITREGRDFFYAPPETIGSDRPLLHPRGGLTAAPQDGLPQIQKFLERWSAVCPNLRMVTKEEALSLVPAFDPDWIQGGCFDPDWVGIDVHELLMTYQRGIKANGSELRCDAEVRQIERRSGRFVVTTRSEDTASRVINAAGAWAQMVGELAGCSGMPLQPLRRTAVLLPLPEGAADWPLVHMADGSLYFKPESNGLMVSPADETPSAAVDARPEELDVAIAIDRFETVMGRSVPRVLHTWAGLRTFAPDRYPVVGSDPRVPGFYWLAGQGGFGVQTSPGLGSMVAADVFEGKKLPSAIQAERYVA